MKSKYSKKVLQNCFKCVLKFHKTMNALIFVIHSLTIIITILFIVETFVVNGQGFLCFNSHCVYLSQDF
jgi:succinate dehydrogenase/fumarate reductase cytochrome b subunit